MWVISANASSDEAFIAIAGARLKAGLSLLLQGWLLYTNDTNGRSGPRRKLESASERALPDLSDEQERCTSIRWFKES